MCGIIKTMNGDGGIDFKKIGRRIRACDYLVVAQLFLQDNFLLEHLDKTMLTCVKEIIALKL